MFTQPSVNQIASAYQGNPAPLGQKVEADKKQHGGIPQDLRQLLALNDITQGRNAMGIQQALQAPTNMPTVAQDLQERARQALQARQMQAMQEMQRKNGQPNMVPPGTPRPPMQPQGLDSLEANVGDGYAYGGIIGDVAHFDGKTGSDVEDPTEKNKSWIERFLYSNISPAERARKDALEAQAEAGRTIPTKLNEERDRAMAEVNKPEANKTQETLERLGMVTRQEQPMQQVIGQNPAKPPAPAPAPAQTGPRVNANVPAQPGSITNLVAPADTEALGILKKDMRRDPEAEAAALKAKYLAEVGNKDLSIYDQMAQEYKARKERLNAPKPGYDATMEYLAQIAQGGGRNWMEAGARGAANQNALQRSRLEQQDALTEKILDLGAKKSEAQFAEKKGMFEMTQAEKKSVYDKAYDAAKAVNMSDDKAKELASQALQKELDRKNHLQVAAAGARDQLMSRAQALMKVDPKLGLEEAMKRAAMAAGATQMESLDVRKLGEYNKAKKEIESRYMPVLLNRQTPDGAKMRAELAAELAKARIDAGLPPEQGINALPSAGGPTSSNVRSQADSIIAGGR